MVITVGSLFSGCGGLDLGFEHAGYDVKWMCEIDKWCNKVLANRFPSTPNLLDATDLSDAEEVDVLIGGFPCQPVSAAGRKNGVDDPRWLWPAFDRAIRHIQPYYVVVENVPGLFNRGFGDVLGALALQGYDAEWFSLQSSDVGAPHRRKRVYILASNTNRLRFWPKRGEAPGEQGEIGRQKNDYFPYGSSKGRIQAAAIADSISGRFKKHQQGWKLQLLGEDGQDTSDSHGERQQGFPEDNSQDGSMEIQGRDNPDGRNSDVAHSDSEYEYRTGQTGTRRWEEPTDGYFGTYTDAIRRWEGILRPVPNPKDDRGRISVEFVEWMMGFPEDWTEGVSRTQRLKMLGNAVQVQCAELVGNLLMEKIRNG